MYPSPAKPQQSPSSNNIGIQMVPATTLRPCVQSRYVHMTHKRQMAQHAGLPAYSPKVPQASEPFSFQNNAETKAHPGHQFGGGRPIVPADIDVPSRKGSLDQLDYHSSSPSRSRFAQAEQASGKQRGSRRRRKKDIASAACSSICSSICSSLLQGFRPSFLLSLVFLSLEPGTARVCHPAAILLTDLSSWLHIALVYRLSPMRRSISILTLHAQTLPVVPVSPVRSMEGHYVDGHYWCIFEVHPVLVAGL